MSLAEYPASLPKPEGFGWDPASRLAVSDLDGSIVHTRSRTRDLGAIANVKFRFLRDQYYTFVKWWQSDLLRGNAWFYVELPSAGGLTWHIARFVGPYRAKLMGHRYWSVTADLEVVERALDHVIRRNQNNILLCHFDDVLGPTKVIDDSPIQAESQLYTSGPIVASNARIYPAVGPFGGSAWQHEYQPGNRLVWFPERPEYALGRVFTIEFFIKLWYNYSSAYLALCGQNGILPSYTQPRWAVYVNRAGPNFVSKDLRYSGDNGAQPLSVDATNTYFTYQGAWNHVAVTCDGQYLRIFCNGKLPPSRYSAEKSVAPTGQYGCQPIGACDINLFGSRDDGWGLPNQWLQTGECMAELRIRKECLYTDNFAPPTGRLSDTL